MLSLTDHRADLKRLSLDFSSNWSPTSTQWPVSLESLHLSGIDQLDPVLVLQDLSMSPRRLCIPVGLVGSHARSKISHPPPAIPHSDAITELDLSCATSSENDPPLSLRSISDIISVLSKVELLKTSFQGEDLETLIELMPRNAPLKRLELVQHCTKCKVSNTFAMERNLIKYNPKLTNLVELRVQRMGSRQSQESLSKVCATQGVKLAWFDA